MVYVFIVTSLFIACASTIAVWSRHHKRQFFSPLVSASGVVETPLNPNGSVFVQGELWLACSVNGNAIPAKTSVTVIGVNDHLLLVALF
jgi:membrane-bound ClpP family serine protease